MSLSKRIEEALENALALTQKELSPPALADAVRYAVFPGGARVRPRLCMAVAEACGGDQPEIANCAAAAIELLHCASLVHDDLPCFDDAETRRGKPSVHKAYGEQVALLAGDALIVLGFQNLIRTIPINPSRAATVFEVLSHSTGLPSGIVAGQAWETEPNVPLERYQSAKTGSLFAAATMAGAASAGMDPAPWQGVGQAVGEAYQVADDLLDVAADPAAAGKDVGQDLKHDRPNAAHALGVAGAGKKLEGLIAAAMDAIPQCSGEAALRELMVAEAEALLSKRLSALAA